MSWWQRLVYYFLLYFFKLLGLLPKWFLYSVVSGFLYLLLYRILRYRVGVARENLVKSFPDKEPKELRRIERRFYWHLSEVFVDTIDMSSMTKKQFKNRVTFANIDEFNDRMGSNNWIAALSHYGSWEFFGAYALHTESHTVLGVYRPLHNKIFDELFKKIRSRFGLEPVTMKNILRRIVESRQTKQNIAVGLIADQHSPYQEEAVWYDFLNQKTQFFNGIEKIATKFRMPVHFAEVRKVGRSRYIFEFVEIYDGAERLAEGEITRRYAEKLERLIEHDPAHWMWSHRRWKSSDRAPGYEG